MSFTIDSNSDFSEGSQEEPSVVFPLPSIRSHHESQESCQICSCRFQKAGPSHTQKRHCHFCYNAICSRCLQFEYFHSETGHSESMCSKCHHLLTALTLDYSEDLSKYRLERQELRKQIKLAAEQKEFYMKERQIVSNKLETLRKNLELSVNDMNAELEKLRQENKTLEKKKVLAVDALKDLEFRKGLVKENFLGVSHIFNALKKDKEKEFRENEKRREEYNQIVMKIAFLKNHISKEDSLGDEGVTSDFTKAEISEVTENLEKIMKKCRRKERKNKELYQKIRENSEFIEELLRKFNEIKENPHNQLGFEEVQRLGELQKQLNDLNTLISILEKRKCLTKDIQERRSEVIHSSDHESFQNNERKTYHVMILPCEESLPLDTQNGTNNKDKTNPDSLKPKTINGKEKEKKSEPEPKTRECDKYCSNCDII